METKTCEHLKRGRLETSGSAEYHGIVGRNSNDDPLGAIRLEFCDECGLVFVANVHLSLPKFEQPEPPPRWRRVNAKS